MNYNNVRRKTRSVRVGDLTIGGSAPIVIQSMTNTDTHDFDATLAQVKALQAAGCDVVRLTVPNAEAAETIARLKREIPEMPLVADIHFDYRAALAAVKAGADKIRINPGNIGDESRVRAVVEACKERGLPIRIGVNGGSRPPRPFVRVRCTIFPCLKNMIFMTRSFRSNPPTFLR